MKSGQEIPQDLSVKENSFFTKMKIDIHISKNPYGHINQIITGFYMLFGNNVQLHTSEVIASRSHILVECNDVRIIYDLDDGYNIDAIKKDITLCDYYFKRSFSTIRNKEIGLDVYGSKCQPLGFNYDVSLPGKLYGVNNSIFNPQNSLHLILSQCVKRVIHLNKPENFEEVPSYKVDSGKPMILFSTRLWEGEENYGINTMRIGIIRALKEKYGNTFRGGLTDSALSRQMASDLIISKLYTHKYSYLRRLHSSDICIASTGLHESIGWKTGEYVASSKAVVCEKLNYEVPGDWMKNKNYIEFDSVESCVSAVDYLVNNPDQIVAMQNANREYYLQYLKPDVLVANTLHMCKLL